MYLYPVDVDGLDFDNDEDGDFDDDEKMLMPYGRKMEEDELR